MRVLSFPWKRSLEIGSSGLCGVSVAPSGLQAPSVIVFSHPEQGAEPFIPNASVQDGCSTSRIIFLFQAGERRPRGDKTLVVAKSSPSKSSPRGSIKCLGSHRSCYNCHVITSCHKGSWSLLFFFKVSYTVALKKIWSLFNKEEGENRYW